MQIRELTIDKWLGIKLLKVVPGKMTLITGDNGVGKSSFVQAIEAAFKSPGKDPDLIYENGDKATIHVKLDGDIDIRRVVTPTGSTVRVMHSGEKMDKPQKFLDTLFNERNFNPVAFFAADKRERRRILLAALPITMDVDKVMSLLGDIEAATIARALNWDRFDFSEHGLVVAQKIRDSVFEQRHAQGQVMTQLAKAIDQDRADLPATVDVERFKDFDHETKLAEFEEAQGAVATHERKCDKLRSIQSRAEERVAKIELLRNEIKQVEEELEALKAEGADLRNEVESFEAPPVDGMRAELQQFQGNQKLLLKLEEIEKREAQLADEKAHHEQLDELVKIMRDTLPKLLLSEARLPVEGLDIRDDDILINGRAIDKLSTSEKMRLAVRIARATMVGELRAICLDGFEVLATSAQKAFIKETEGDDIQYFIAKVTDGPLATTQVEESQASPAA